MAISYIDADLNRPFPDQIQLIYRSEIGEPLG